MSPQSSPNNPLPGRGKRALAATLAAVVINVLIIAALAHSGEPYQKRGDDIRTVPFSVVKPPPPPPERPPEQAPTESTPVQQSMPSLDLPPIGDGDSGLALPTGDGLGDGWNLPLEMPAYEVTKKKDTGPRDRPPELLFIPNTQNLYPRIAQRRGIAGRTVARLTLDQRGKVVDATILESEPAGVFDEATKRAVARVRYRPAIRGGKPVESVVDLEFTWTPEEEW